MRQVLTYVLLAAAAAWCMVRGIQLSTRVGMVLEVLSIGAILAVIAVVLGKQGLEVGAVLAGRGSALGRVALGMVLAILGFVGFESAASLGVEASEPRRMVPRAVLGSAGLAGLLYVLSAYTQLVGFGGDTAALSGSASALNELAAAAGVSTARPRHRRRRRAVVLRLHHRLAQRRRPHRLRDGPGRPARPRAWAPRTRCTTRPHVALYSPQRGLSWSCRSSWR